MRVVPLLIVMACFSGAARAAAQGLPTEPVSVAGGRVVFGGEVFVTMGEEDPGWFNYTDYEFNALRNIRASLSTETRPSKYLQVLAEVRLDHGEHLSAYALFLRVRPWPERRFDIQVGRVPPTFGAFSRTAYAYDNLVIGQPLAYQYLLSLRTDAVPRTADDLLRTRGSGWLTGYPVGNPERAPGVPLFNSNRYDTGVQVHGVAGPVEWTGAVTTGLLSDPRLGDNNGRPQVAGRAIVRFGPAIRIGGSVARGAWLDESLDPVLPSGDSAGDYRQSAFAVDAEASAGRWLARAEWLHTSWRLPAFAAPVIGEPVKTRSLIVEGRYRLWPGASLAARADALGFDDLTGSTTTLPWEAPVRRIETAFSLTVMRNITGKIAWQVNRRDGGGVRHDSLWAGQLVGPVLTPMTQVRRLVVIAGVLAALAWPLMATARPPAAQSRVPAPGGIRGRLILARTPRADERRPEVSSPGSAGPRDASDRRPGVVYLEQAPRGAFDEPVRAKAVMDQRNERFVPHVLAVSVGTVVDFPNSDRTYHNVFSLSRARRFDLGRYAAGRSKSVRMDWSGVVRVFCDIHSHMNAFVLVFAHPFFDVTAPDGRFELANVPPGTYTVVGWHEGEPRVTRPVTVPSDGWVEADLLVP